MSEASRRCRRRPLGRPTISDSATTERVRRQSMTAILGALEVRGFVRLLDRLTQL